MDGVNRCSAGLLGPTLRAQEGETIVVTFRNMADRDYSLHPHGIAYGKQSEGGCLQFPLGLLAYHGHTESGG